MKKKTYIQPHMEATQLHPTTLVCTSSPTAHDTQGSGVQFAPIRNTEDIDPDELTDW